MTTTRQVTSPCGPSFPKVCTCMDGNYGNGGTCTACTCSHDGEAVFCKAGEFSCNGLPNGNYPDPEDCSKYYSCSNGIAYSMPCPAGLNYNEDIGVCDWPVNVDCACYDTVAELPILIFMISRDLDM
ncbi:hypothetical protein Bbelb_240100 [Branchiostoma belcheri]|nr:hypothetical protein Bbelb_240100 [Branchiostoma belcheri]